uniref:Uncharacterized protein n=1 Tax=Cynoglossus semilaevis TaxID=244447 RepID=A0A3P8W6I6_CYNSE
MSLRLSCPFSEPSRPAGSPPSDRCWEGWWTVLSACIPGWPLMPSPRPLEAPLPVSVVFSSMTSLQREEFFELVATTQARRLSPPKEDLYDMILTTQAQGRLEDQRSRAPGPMDDEDFFSLLLRVQGGRMDEQRTALPCMLQT